MFKYLFAKHKLIMKLSLTAIIFTLIFGVLLIIDTIQKGERESKAVSYELIEDDGDIRAYNVDGMTDEEIASMLAEERSKRMEGN